MKSRGFTLIELIVVVVVIGLLIPLTMFTMNGLTLAAQDREREGDVSAIARQLELVYTNKLVDNAPNYPGIDSLSASDKTAIFGGGTTGVTEAPGTNAFSIVGASNANANTTTVSPQPTITTYVYQPLTAAGDLCTSKCGKFNLYYLKKSDNTVVMVKSKRQQ
jgi:prepilin-type N-terminal cleavage/methylation domain-containing protein